jgi:hypothetical protein
LLQCQLIGGGQTAPVIAGPAAGIAFLLVFSILADSLSTTTKEDDQTEPAKEAFVILAISDLKTLIRPASRYRLP